MEDISLDNQLEVIPDNTDESEMVPESPIAGFWRRLLAFALDSLFIWLFGGFLGLVYFDEFVSMGNWGRLIGLIVFVAYFGFLNSTWGGGQSLGKRICKIMVVGTDGQNISIQRSMLRAAILGLPGILNNYTMPLSGMNTPSRMFGLFIIGMSIFGVGLGIIYFYIFNTRTRQSLHDLICSTYVVMKNSADPVVKEKIWKGHMVFYGIILAFILLISVGFNVLMSRIMFMDNAMNTLQKLEKINGVYSAVLADNSMILSKMFKTDFNYGPHYIVVTVQIKDKDLLYRDDSTKILNCVLENYPQARKRDYIDVQLVYGYNIGIHSGSKIRVYRWQNPEAASD